MTNNDMYSFCNSAETLRTVLESAYEGIAVVDANGYIIEFNDAYCRFLNKRKEDVLGKYVTKVIDNTRLHIVLKTGVAERGYIQKINGQDMVVHRIPVMKDGNVIGAIGMLIFKGVTELHHILEKLQALSRKIDEPSSTLQKEFKLDSIIGESENMQVLKILMQKAARTPSTVLITGESGTGKEMVAKAIHRMSPFSQGPFVSVNCSAIPDHLLEAELFGYEEGAFTGARKGGKPGKFELAHKGTLFLDEIGDMPLLMQSKILRALQERQIERVGAIMTQSVDVRIIAATHRDLEKMVDEGAFREDLYYRLNIIRCSIPPLRERKDDIPVLVAHYLNTFSERIGIPTKTITPEAVHQLAAYHWRGNIRELVNMVEMLVSMVDGPVIDVADLPSHITSSLAPADRNDSLWKKAKEKSSEREKQLILQVMNEVGGNKAAAARKLGIQRATLYEKLKRYELI